jgi:hypothetical protein
MQRVHIPENISRVSVLESPSPTGEGRKDLAFLVCEQLRFTGGDRVSERRSDKLRVTERGLDQKGAETFARWQGEGRSRALWH